MKCPACQKETRVVDSRITSDGFGIRRRRECLDCGLRFSTNEELEILGLTIVKRSGQKEAYQREKLTRGLERSLEKRPVTPEQFQSLVSAIERDIQALRKSEVASEQIGEIVIKHLWDFDRIAYIRFASVYKSFQNVEEFSEELSKMMNKKGKRYKE